MNASGDHRCGEHLREFTAGLPAHDHQRHLEFARRIAREALEADRLALERGAGSSLRSFSRS